MSLFQESFKILSDHQSVRLFNVILAASQIFGIFAIFLVALWMAGFNGGFSAGLQFHYHPTFMVMGLIFLAGDVALKAVFDSHNNNKDDKGQPDPLPNMYSLHSWIGLTSVIAFFSQYLLGFVTFFYPGWNISMRQLILPYHQAFGLLILCFIGITAVMGISEQAAWHHKCWTVDHVLCNQQLISTLLGICILMFVMCIVIIVLNPRWRRQPLPEEETLHHLTNID